MNEHNPGTLDGDPAVDAALERIVAWRSTRSAPTGLLREIRSALEPVEQRRAFGVRALDWSGSLPPIFRLAILGLLVALLAAVGVGVAVVGSRPNLGDLAPRPRGAVATTGPSGLAGPSASAAAFVPAKAFDCVARPPASAATPSDLTGTWSDRANFYYLRQVGKTVWGFAINSIESPTADLSELGPYLILRGAVTGDGTIHVDWAAAGQRYPGDTRFSDFSDKSGSLVWTIAKATDGSITLVTSDEKGDGLSGNAYQLPTLVPCMPVVH